MNHLTPSKLGALQSDEKVEREIQRLKQEAFEIERLKEAGAVELDHKGETAPRTLGDLGITNRRAARRAGLRSPKRQRSMAVPSKKAKHPTRRSS